MLWSGPHGGVLTLLKAVLCLKMPEKRGNHLLIQTLHRGLDQAQPDPGPGGLNYLEPPNKGGPRLLVP